MKRGGGAGAGGIRKRKVGRVDHGFVRGTFIPLERS